MPGDVVADPAAVESAIEQKVLSLEDSAAVTVTAGVVATAGV